MASENYKKYLGLSGTVIIFVVMAAALFNYIVDPCDLLGNNRIGVYSWNERQLKGEAILSYPHDAVLIGSSKVLYINPDDLFCFRFYNASLRGAFPEEIYFYLKKTLRDETLALVGFDFYMFNEREFPLVGIKDWDDLQYSVAEYLLGGHMIELSYETLEKWRKHKKAHEMKDNGQFVYHAPKGTTAADLALYKQQYNSAIEDLKKRHYGAVSYSEKRMAFVRKLKTFLDSSGVRYAVFINPLSEDLLAGLKETDAYDLFLSWRQEMKTIFPDIYDFSVSRYSAREGFRKVDPFHFLGSTGAAFLNEIIKDFCPETSQPQNVLSGNDGQP
ncbi:MAG: hypothetical protein SWH61_09910 [Thermodesulfobacteriota bacterium]|nr:hypothetical protein [Thermodesulfobacteriota bacterium]